ncbi:P-loop containing nucleoside triphosphate hydrolase [Phytophthora cactorum]|nr:P-loop containing nucleoside triphosphate hydrolase [Phytophthora cactorum]
MGSHWGGSGSKSVALLVLEGSRSRRLSEKVLLPVLRNPVCSNQLDADAAEREWDDRHRRSRRRRRHEKLEPLQQLAYVYLPPVFPCYEHHYESRRHGRGITTKTYGRQHRRRDYDTGTSDEDSSNCNASDEDDDIPVPLKPTTMRSQRMRSLATMSKLQHDAATTIQREYRFYRRRQINQDRRNQRLAKQAQAFLDIFLLQEVTRLVPVCLLEVLRETCAQRACWFRATRKPLLSRELKLLFWRCSQEAAMTKRREDVASSVAEDVLASLVDESIRDVFHGVLQAMVKSYLAQEIDLSRAATPTAVAVATDILDNWTKELVVDLLPEGRPYESSASYDIATGPSLQLNHPSDCCLPTVTMSTPFVSSLRTSLGATGSSTMVSAAPGSTAGKSAMMSMFSGLDLALDASGAVVSNANGGRSAAKDLLASKNAEKQAEAELAASHALKKQQQQKQQQMQKKEQPVTALGQALELFDREMDERESFMSRNTKRRQKGSKKTRGGTPSRGRRQRQDKYKRTQRLRPRQPLAGQHQTQWHLAKSSTQFKSRFSRRATTPNPSTLQQTKVAPPSTSVKLITPQMQFATDLSVKLGNCLELTNFTVVGVMGLEGVGKSTVLSLLAQKKIGEKEIFSTRSLEAVVMDRHETTGVDLAISMVGGSGHPTVLLDSQPLLSSSMLADLLERNESQRFGALTPEQQVEAASYQIAVFLCAICHYVVVVHDGLAYQASVTELLRKIEQKSAQSRLPSVSGNSQRHAAQLLYVANSMADSELLYRENELFSAHERALEAAWPQALVRVPYRMSSYCDPAEDDNDVLNVASFVFPHRQQLIRGGLKADARSSSVTGSKKVKDQTKRTTFTSSKYSDFDETAEDFQRFVLSLPSSPSFTSQAAPLSALTPGSKPLPPSHALSLREWLSNASRVFEAVRKASCFTAEYTSSRDHH